MLATLIKWAKSTHWIRKHVFLLLTPFFTYFKVVFEFRPNEILNWKLENEIEILIFKIPEILFPILAFGGVLLVSELILSLNLHQLEDGVHWKTVPFGVYAENRWLSKEILGVFLIVRYLCGIHFLICEGILLHSSAFTGTMSFVHVGAAISIEVILISISITFRTWLQYTF